MNRRTFIVGVCVLHSIRAGCLLWSAAPLGVTSLNAISSIFGNRYNCALALFCATVMALYGEFHGTKEKASSVLWFLPQGFIITLSAIGALVCICSGMYADKVPRPVEFVMADQVIYLLLFLGYYRAISRY